MQLCFRGAQRASGEGRRRPARPGRGLVFAAVGSLLLAGLLASASLAQNAGWKYAVLQVDKTLEADRSELTKRKNLVRDVLRGQANVQQNQEEFDGFFLRYYFPLLTRPDEVGKLTETRDDFFKQFVRAAKSPQAHAHLNELTLKAMRALAAGNYHPALRYTAMLIVGQLNLKEPVQVGSAPAPAVPLGTALPVMLEALESADQIDAVKVAALLGILRHVQLDKYQPPSDQFRQATQVQIINAMLGLVEAKQPPAGRSLAGHTWMRRRAVEILGELGIVGAQANVARALAQVVADRQEPLVVRCAAAGAEGRITYPAALSTGAGPLVRGLGVLAVDACNAELDQIAAFQQQLIDQKREIYADGGGEQGAGGPNSKVPKVEETQLAEISRRRLAFRVQQILDGLGGTGAQTGVGALATDDPVRSFARQLLQTVSALRTSLDLPPTSLTALSQSVQVRAIELEDLVKPATPAPAPASPATPAGGPPGAIPSAGLPGAGPPGSGE